MSRICEDKGWSEGIRRALSGGRSARTTSEQSKQKHRESCSVSVMACLGESCKHQEGPCKPAEDTEPGKGTGFYLCFGKISFLGKVWSTLKGFSEPV